MYPDPKFFLGRVECPKGVVLRITQNVTCFKPEVTFHSDFITEASMPAELLVQNLIAFRNLKQIIILDATDLKKKMSLEKISYVLQDPAFEKVEQICLEGRGPILEKKSLGKLPERIESKSFPRIILAFESFWCDDEKEPTKDINGGFTMSHFIYPKDCAALTWSPKKPFTVTKENHKPIL